MKKNTRLLAVLLALGLLALSLTACAASSKYVAETTASVSNSAAYDSAPMEEPAPTTQETAEFEEMKSENGALSMTTEVTQDDAPEAASTDVASKIIYSADLSAQTTDFDAAIATLDAQITAFGGFIERSDINGDTRYNDDGTTTVVNRWAYYTVRIPCEQFESFLHETEGFGNVTSTSRDAQNVTSAYTDFEARLSSLNTQEERLLDMLAKSEDVETLIALEQRLSDVRYEIESIERNLRNYDMQIKYSTVDLDLREVEIYTPTVSVTRTFGEKLSDSLADGWKSFTRSIQYLILDLASALPALILLAVIIVVVIVLVKKYRKKRRARKAAQQPPQDGEQKPQ